ncbi:MAG: helix-turn-helix transcriptional regulator [Chthoniobacteraceae bacterium]
MKTPFTRTVGMNICRARSHREWTQLRLAAEADVDLTTVQRWESGRAVPVGFDLLKLSIALRT